MNDHGDHTPNTFPTADRATTIPTRRRARRLSARASLSLLLLAGLLAAYVPTSWALDLRLVIAPDTASVPSGSTVLFTAWECPTDSDGAPALGPDGVPGTSDDFCQAVSVEWNIVGPIGTLSDATGTSTVLGTPELSPGQTVSGFVAAASASGQTALATVDVFGPAALFFCSAAEGETVKEEFEHTDIDGTVYEVLLECRNGVNALFSMGSDPSGKFFEINGSMELGTRLKETYERISKPALDELLPKKAFLEQEHKARDIIDDLEFERLILMELNRKM